MDAFWKELHGRGEKLDSIQGTDGSGRENVQNPHIFLQKPVILPKERGTNMIQAYKGNLQNGDRCLGKETEGDS